MSKADELAKLDSLRKSGVLTQEEFEAEKVKPLDDDPSSFASSSLQPIERPWPTANARKRGKHAETLVEVAEGSTSA